MSARKNKSKYFVSKNAWLVIHHVALVTSHYVYPITLYFNFQLYFLYDKTYIYIYGHKYYYKFFLSNFRLYLIIMYNGQFYKVDNG